MGRAPSIELTDKQILATTVLFQGVSSGTLATAVKNARTVVKTSGEFFFLQEDPATLVYVLVKGRLRLTQVTPNGQQVNLSYVTPAEAYGVVACLSEARYPVSAEALEDSTALAWEKTSIERLMREDTQIALNAIRILSSRIQEFQDRLRELATERVERRIARAILRLVRQAGRQTADGVLIDFPITRQDLAEMTGTTLYTVSRTLSQWENQGIIQSGRERILIRFPHGLVAIAEDLPDPNSASD